MADPVVTAPPSELADLGDRLASIPAGLEALERRLSATERAGHAGSEDRVTLLTLAMALEDGLHRLEGLGVVSGNGLNAAPTLGDLRVRLDDASRRIRLLTGDVPLAQPRPRRADAPLRRRAMLAASGRVLTAVGLAALLFIGYELALSGLIHDRSQHELLSTFTQDIVTTRLDAAASVPAEGSPVALLQVPRIGLEQVVVEGTSPEDLKAGPGHLRASPLPGEFGLAVIAGRRTTYGGPFHDLDRLAAGDHIAITTGQGTFAYQVTGVHRANAGQASSSGVTSLSRLELVTSDPTYLASGRLIVDARLQGNPVDVANRPPVPVASADLGLAGDPVGLVFALIWSQVFVLVLWLARWARTHNHWPRTVTYMLATPMLMALAVLAFSSLDRVIPGTL